jgi:hypothetical protein
MVSLLPSPLDIIQSCVIGRPVSPHPGPLPQGKWDRDSSTLIRLRHLLPQEKEWEKGSGRGRTICRVKCLCRCSKFIGFLTKLRFERHHHSCDHYNSSF